MPTGTPKWIKFRNWSGISIRGTNRYQAPGKPTENDVIVAACTRPEGGAYDTFVSYDGTAATWGLTQWTFTSGRLQRLLREIEVTIGTPKYSALFGMRFFDLTGCEVTSSGKLSHERLHGVEIVSDKGQLRDLLTPPAGQVPRTGSKFDYAVEIAKLFASFGQDPTVAKVQERFFLEELVKEAPLKRPKMDGRTIASYLHYPKTAELAEEKIIAARALFWAMWQNSPRAAEEHMHRALQGQPFGLSDLDKLARVYGRSAYAYWGNAKCASLKDEDGNPTPRESRYHKVASEINKVMGSKLLDPDT